MGFFDNFKLFNKKSGLVIRYKDKTFLTIKPDVLRHIIIDHITKKTVIELIENNGISNNELKNRNEALVLLKTYNTARKKFYNNRPMKGVSPKSASFVYFIRAAGIIKNLNTTAKLYIKSQIAGLKFVKGGTGVFPIPKQLVTITAEERFHNYVLENENRNDPKNVERLELKQSDKDTGLMNNPRFKSRYDKMRNDTATLQDAYFVYDCMLIRKDSVTSFVKEYVAELESKYND